MDVATIEYVSVNVQWLAVNFEFVMRFNLDFETLVVSCTNRMVTAVAMTAVP